MFIGFVKDVKAALGAVNTQTPVDSLALAYHSLERRKELGVSRSLSVPSVFYQASAPFRCVACNFKLTSGLGIDATGEIFACLSKDDGYLNDGMHPCNKRHLSSLRPKPSV
jgi:hypothetical protein